MVEGLIMDQAKRVTDWTSQAIILHAEILIFP